MRFSCAPTAIHNRRLPVPRFTEFLHDLRSEIREYESRIEAFRTGSSPQLKHQAASGDIDVTQGWVDELESRIRADRTLLANFGMS